MLSRLRGPGSDSGVGLADLLVSVMLMGLLLAMCATAVISGSRTTTKVQDRAQALAGIQQAVQRAARHLRAVSPLLTATASGFTLNEVRSGSTWFIAVDTPVVGTTRQLRYREWPCPAPPCTSVPTTAPAVTETWVADLLPPVTPVAGGQWFRYSSLSGGTVTVSSAPTGPLADVFSVDVALRARVRGGLQPVESLTTVAVRNSTASTDLS